MNAAARRSQPATARRGVSFSAWLPDLCILLATLAVFWPLVRFYLTQDDYILIERATRGFGDAIGGAFEPRPGQFRPLSKGVWFVFAHGAFGLNAAAYHVVSILLHALNAILLGGVLRRLGVSATASRTAALMYAVSAAHLEAVAWASCVQQLLGATGAFLCLRFGLDALARPGLRTACLATAAYAFALLSYEQTVVTPLVLLLWVCLRDGVAGLRRALGVLWMPLALLALYAAFMLLYKGLPESGPYQMSAGVNVWNNLCAYTRAAFSFWMLYPAAAELATGFGVSHALLLVPSVYLLARRRWRGVVFAWGTLLLYLLPVLFQKAHTHSFHLIVPGVATFYLLALTLDDAAALAGKRHARIVALVGGLLVVVVLVGSLAAARRNANTPISDKINLPRSFVLRRAVLAERLLTGIRERYEGQPRLMLRYRYPEYQANWLNVHAALGQGSGVRLALNRPGLEVVFSPPADIPSVEEMKSGTLQLLIYSELGQVFTLDEAQRLWGSAPADSAR